MRHLKVAPSAEVSDKFKALTAFAETGQDREQALEFSIQEKRAQRFWRDKPLGSLTGTARFWFGVVHEAGSNYGRSIGRPLAIWIIALYVFAAYYLARSDVNLVSFDHANTLPEWLGGLPEFAQSIIGVLYDVAAKTPDLACVNGDPVALRETLGFSVQAALFQSFFSNEFLTAGVSQCLFGIGSTRFSGVAALPADVAFMAAAQGALSLLLIGFFVHALWLRFNR